ncbi:hypothetical protein [Streptomyces sp. MB09-02B]|uniref:hypothetical protein n=1 Tax=Streptomyces sp. MB09-02B TaxID=3028667 RepID=UPI0029B81A1B|nr:hypothetical protein [Streptomyces sp. MB09-02B]MDX3638190.1 hypothetical protein [Streptomyces sp. MB09-02B]
MTAGRSARTLRAAMFAVVCVLAAVQGHVMASDLAVPGWALAAGAVAAGGAAWSLAGRERGLLVVASFAVITQVALHALFSLAQALAATTPSGGAPLVERWTRSLLCSPPAGGAGGVGTSAATHSMSHAMAGAHSHHSMGSTDAAGSMSGMENMSGADSMGAVTHGGHAGHGMDGMSSTGMLVAHLVTALLCALWLAHGERAVFRVLRVLAGWLAAPLGLLLRLPAPPHRPRIRARRSGSSRVLRQLLLVHAITSRGPPVGTAVL